MARSGSREELMQGPFFYGAALLGLPTSQPRLLTRSAAVACLIVYLVFWTAPVTVLFASALFLGDGLADPVGRLLASPSAGLIGRTFRVGPSQRSIAGCAAFFAATVAAAMLWAPLYLRTGHWDAASFTWPTFWDRRPRHGGHRHSRRGRLPSRR